MTKQKLIITLSPEATAKYLALINSIIQADIEADIEADMEADMDASGATLSVGIHPIGDAVSLVQGNEFTDLGDVAVNLVDC